MPREVKITGLSQKTNGRWIYVRKIPVRLRDHFPAPVYPDGKPHRMEPNVSAGYYRVNLDTKHESEAVVRYVDFAADYDQRIDVAKRKLDDQPKSPPHIPQLEIQRMIERYYTSVPLTELTPMQLLSHNLGGDAHQIASNAIAHELRHLDAIKENTKFDTSDADPVIDCMLEKNNLIVPAGTDLYKQIRTQYWEHQKATAIQNIGDITHRKTDIAAHTPDTSSRGKKTVTLRELYNEYMKNPSKIRGSKTKLTNGYKADSLIELLGGDNRLISTIERHEFDEVRDIFRELTPYFHSKFPKMTVREIHAKLKKLRNEGRDFPKPAAKTINDYMTLLTSMFTFANNKDYVDKSLAVDLKVAVPRKEKNRTKEQFTMEQIKTIFDAELYHGCMNLEYWWRPGNFKVRSGKFWVPLIGLYQGVRLNECCQLLVSDIKIIDGYHCILIRYDDDDGEEVKNVKNESSERFLVIHPMLIKLGFIHHYEQQKKAGETHLFPELPIGSTGYYSDPFNKWFNRSLLKKKLDINGPTFHSLRHMYCDALRAAQVPQDIQRTLGGWSSKNGEEDTIDYKVYGRGYPPDVQHEHISKVTYDVDLSHLIDNEENE
ncbi:site-specific integrase [Terasakiella sp. SH-1]|uniref:site-specific integrase n=1 Tax=Terasakiella sp. SH-1 TaxID=2560057 RepID=UPI001073006F|nr:site-specific integrase [Terasakiella sp. SH-1]